MAEFGVPYGSSMDAHNACLAALDLQVRLEHLNARRAAAGLTIEVSVGVGINIGPAICGNIGSEKRLEYTVIGDSVNVASRVEGCTKAYGVFCIITEDTRSHLQDGFLCRELDFIKVLTPTLLSSLPHSNTFSHFSFSPFPTYLELRILTRHRWWARGGRFASTNS